MWYENKVTTNKAAFLQKVQLIAVKLGIDPNWLMFVMNSESGLNPAAYNPNGGASGLIQFMPATAEGLGTTTAALRKMSNVDQLDYVYKYFYPYRGKMDSLYDLYLVTFFPAALGKPDSYVLQTSTLPAKVIADANPGIDLDGNDQITVGEFKRWIDLKKKSMGIENGWNVYWIFGSVICAGILLWYLLKNDEDD